MIGDGSVGGSVCRPPSATGTLPGHRDSVWRRASPRRTRWSHCCDDYRAESRSCLCESANGSISRHAALFFLIHVSAPVIMALSQHIAVPRRAEGLPCPLNFNWLIDILTSLALFTVGNLKNTRIFHSASLNLI